MGYIRIGFLVAVIVQSTSCSTPTPAAQASRFAEEQAADFIARYYSDETSYVLKPAMTEGAFRSICDRALLLKMAEQQPRRNLAVIVLIHYPGAREEDGTKLAWVSDLKRLGYERIVFLRGGRGMKINGLPVLACPNVPVTFADK